ncbi:type IV pilus biogenesis/stability protein PilW [Sulfuriferula thiophila]|uniref:type IV pilus biogenesis/stability protein PilW n=1 Tax=Sulfuriferula thiophila TaxID=1781211 RepID=UPI000F612D76|nr:type IV pilus biogenesis/stability protein PilW [Sulfuriferula thiophila]
MNKVKHLLTVLLSVTTFTTAYPAFAESSQPTSNANQTNEQTRARIHTELGAGYFSRGQYAVALEELRDALSADNRYAPAYGVMGLVYMELKEDKPAEENFQRAMDLAPGESEIHNNYGWFLCTRNRFDEAIKQFNIALGNPLYPTPERALTNAGICLLQANKPDDAQGYLEKSLKFQPNQAQALTKLAQIYFQQGRLFEARTLIERFFANNQPTAEALWLGVRLARKQSNKDAEASYGLQLRRQFADAPETQLLLQGKYD